jgi:transcriptional regulator with PAS, ATPase and Fis domain
VAAALPRDDRMAVPEGARVISPPATDECGSEPVTAPLEARSARAAWESGHLADVLRRHQGNRRAVAQELGVSERTVYRMIRRYGLE